MPNPWWARRATAFAMRPNPMRPSVLPLRRRERVVVRVEAGVELAGDLLLHGARQAPGDDHMGAGRTHRLAIARRGGSLATACATVAPSSDGLGATINPAERMISAFSAAVSPKAEMMAPACPIRRPLGAVSPAT